MTLDPNIAMILINAVLISFALAGLAVASLVLWRALAWLWRSIRGKQ